MAPKKTHGKLYKGIKVLLLLLYCLISTMMKGQKKFKNLIYISPEAKAAKQNMRLKKNG